MWFQQLITQKRSTIGLPKQLSSKTICVRTMQCGQFAFKTKPNQPTTNMTRWLCFPKSLQFLFHTHKHASWTPGQQHNPEDSLHPQITWIKPTPPAVFLPCIAQTKQSCQKDCSHISKPQRKHAARTSNAPGQTTTSGVLEQIILRQEANKNQEYRQQGARISDTRLTITFNLLVLSVLN